VSQLHKGLYIFRILFPGTNIMNENWNFPIVIISDNIIIDSLVQCYKDHNTPLSVQEDSWHPLCGLEMEVCSSSSSS
jgi:hypothetical protein